MFGLRWFPAHHHNRLFICLFVVLFVCLCRRLQLNRLPRAFKSLAKDSSGKELKRFFHIFEKLSIYIVKVYVVTLKVNCGKTRRDRTIIHFHKSNKLPNDFSGIVFIKVYFLSILQMYIQSNNRWNMLRDGMFKNSSRCFTATNKLCIMKLCNFIYILSCCILKLKTAWSLPLVMYFVI